MTPRLMTVEIHDVSPAYWPAVHAIHSRLMALGVPAPTLLVVPELEAGGRRWDLREQPYFVEWLRTLVSAGSEIVLHGLTHRAPGPPPIGLRAAFMHYVYSRGCAEFAHLDFLEAQRRLRRGRQILTECGLKAGGFIAPAWQQSEGARAAVVAEGFTFSAYFDSVWSVDRPNERRYAPALTFAAGHAVVDLGKRAYMRAVELIAAKEEVIRVAIHPEDTHRAGLIDHIAQRIVAQKRRRHIVSYDTIATWGRGARDERSLAAA